MACMETEATQTNEQLTALGQRLTVVERDLVTLAENVATKADLLQLEARIMKWMIVTLIGVGLLNSTLALIVAGLLHV